MGWQELGPGPETELRAAVPSERRVSWQASHSLGFCVYANFSGMSHSLCSLGAGWIASLIRMCTCLLSVHHGNHGAQFLKGLGLLNSRHSDFVSKGLFWTPQRWFLALWVREKWTRWLNSQKKQDLLRAFPWRKDGFGISPFCCGSSWFQFPWSQKKGLDWSF